MLYSRYATREHINVNENDSQLDKKRDWAERESIGNSELCKLGNCSPIPALLSIHVLKLIQSFR